MAIFEYGEYKIDIDESKTKMYFDQVETSDFQECRNFQKYVNEMISDDERQFFEALHINLLKVDFCHGEVLKNKQHYYNFQTYIIGDFLSFPDVNVESIKDVSENDLYEIINANDIVVGNFKVHISTPNEYDNSADEYENTIYIEFYVTIPWLLDEKFIRIEFSEFIEVLKVDLKYRLSFISRYIAEKKRRKTEKELLNAEFERLKTEYSMDYEILSAGKVKTYRTQWVDSILPANTNEQTRKWAYDVCRLKRRHARYLWHLFSYEFIDTIENPTDEFNKLKKTNCILTLECCSNSCVKLKNAEKLTEQDIIELCNRVSGWCDFVITADDFSWAYSRTHEDGWLGPYFYRKD